MAIGIPGGDRQVVVPTVVPTTDPTFTSGLKYARSIAGGENVPNMIAPGVSYSAARPQGYTQMDLPPIVSGLPNIVTDSPPDDPAFLPGGGAVNPPDYTNLPPNIIGGGRGDNINILDDMRFPPPQDFLRNYKPFDFGGIQNILDSFKGDIGGPEIDKSLIVDRDVIERPFIRGLEDRDAMRDEMFIERLDEPMYEFVPPVNIGGPALNTSIIPEREILERPLISGLENRDTMDDFMSIQRINEPRIEDINIPQIPDISKFIINDDLPVFEEPRFIEDINTFNNFDPFLNQPMIPNGSDFSIEQPMIPSGSRFSIAQPIRGLLR
jgi:hypothetical protein